MLSKKDIALEAKTLRDIPTWRPAVEIALHWLALAALIAAAVKTGIWWLHPVFMLLIGAVQYALLILLHDAQHSLLHPSKQVNNRLATWLIAAPCMTEFERSQKRHLAHHQFFGDPGHDPDYPLYATAGVYSKKSYTALAGHFLRRVTGRKFAGAVGEGKEQHSWLPVIAAQLVLFAVFATTAGWIFYFLLWLMPLAGIAVLLNDLRIFCEHSNSDKDSTAPDDIMISYLGNPLELFFLAPNHMNYHAEHHLFPYVPHSQLPKLRALIRQSPELSDTIQWRANYSGYFLRYLKGLHA